MLKLDKGLENFYFMTMGLEIWGGFKLWVEREEMAKIRLDYRIKKRESLGQRYQWRRYRAANGLKERLFAHSTLVPWFAKWGSL